MNMHLKNAYKIYCAYSYTEANVCNAFPTFFATLTGACRFQLANIFATANVLQLTGLSLYLGDKILLRKIN